MKKISFRPNLNFMGNQNIILWILFLFFLPDLPAASPVRVLKSNIKSKTVFAVVVDQTTFDACKKEIIDYKNVLESEGLGTYIYSSDWETPESVKTEIEKLVRKNPPLEGVVFIGDIPIARIRQAQHMTTAFKMNERTFPMTESSVTSDRFYDDLDLKFDYIGKDTINPRHFYYNLTAEGAQQITPDFYSARIKVPEGISDKYEALQKYLVKVVDAHKNPELFDNFIYFQGHGYNSDCMTAWRNQTTVFKEHFPLAYETAAGNTFLNFRQNPYMKYNLFNEMQRTDVDAFLYYEHGAFDTQYINGDFPSQNLGENADVIARYLRSRFKRLKTEVEKSAFIAESTAKFGVNANMFSIENIESHRVVDSLASADVNINFTDLSRLKTGARISILNACYNGSFHQNDYIAGYHIFNDGRTIVAQGNTVNVLQDKWAEELIGYLAQGIRVGNWQNAVIMLESHLIGDPTFRFRTTTENSYNPDLVITADKQDHWKTLLSDKQPIIRAMAVKHLAALQPGDFNPMMLDLVKNDPSKIVRLQALQALTVNSDTLLTEAVLEGLHDPYEMMQRLSAHIAGDIGDPKLIPALVSISLLNDEAQRVSYAVQNALNSFDPEQVRIEYIKQLDNSKLRNADELKTIIERNINSQLKRVANQLVNIQSNNVNFEDRESAIRTLRNTNLHYETETLLAVLKDNTQPVEIRILLTEALGWFNLSLKKDIIINAVYGVAKDPNQAAKLRAEALKTYKRLKGNA